MIMYSSALYSTVYPNRTTNHLIVMFGGAAVLGALWNKFDLCDTHDFSDLIEHFKKLKKLAD